MEVTSKPNTRGRICKKRKRDGKWKKKKEMSKIKPTNQYSKTYDEI